MTNNDEYAWFREQLNDDAVKRWRDERYRDIALKIMAEVYAFETDAAFIADWTAWAEEEERKKPSVIMTVSDGVLATWNFYGYNDYREDGLKFDNSNPETA